MATANLLQTSVSGGTQNALSLQGDGVFFPKASTTSRLALTLTTTDKGFIVYDTTDNNIYFWNGAAWESVPSSGDAGANGSVQYNDNGIVSGATNFVWDKVNGRVGIGNNGPLSVLTVSSQTNARLSVRTTEAVFGSITGGTALDSLNDAATVLVPFGCRGSTVSFAASGQTVGLQLDASSNVNVPLGNVVMGTSGKGIDFSATPGTGTSELLNDYEEGTFTPTVIGTTTAGTVTYARQLGRYTKVGNLVTVQIYLSWSAGTGTGNLAFGGLPFTIGNYANEYASVAIGQFDNIALTALNVPSIIGSPNTSVFNVNQFPVGGGANSGVAYDAAGGIIMTSTYIA